MRAASPTTHTRRRLAGVLAASLTLGALAAAGEAGDGDVVVDTGVALATGRPEDGGGGRADALVPLRDGGVAFLADETDAGDLNGDGDAHDAVLHVTDGATGATDNLGHAVSAAISHWSDPHAGVAELPDGRLAFVSGGRLLVHDREDGSTIALVHQGVGPAMVALPTGHVVVRRGAGSSRQSLLVLDPMTDAVTDTGHDGLSPRPTADGFVTVTPVDLDDDGSTDDLRILEWNTTTTAAVIHDTQALYSPETLAGGRTAAFAAVEASVGDVNGDGDTQDVVASVIHLDTGAVSSSGRALRSGDWERPFTALPDGRVMFVADGPDGAEHVLFDPATGVVTETGLVADAAPRAPAEGSLREHVLVDDGHVALTSQDTVHVLSLDDGTIADTGVTAPWTTSQVAVTDDGRLALAGRMSTDRPSGYVHDPVAGTTTRIEPPRRVADWDPWSVAAVGDDIVYSGSGVGAVPGGHRDTIAEIVRVLPDGTAVEVAVPFGEAVLAAGPRLAVAADTLHLVTLDATPDTAAPTVGAVVALPDPVEDGEPMTLRATAQDSGGTVAGATVSIDGVQLWELPLAGSPTVAAADGAFDEVSEQVQLHLEHSPAPGTHELCFWAWDQVGNASQDACTTFEVLPGEGPVVTDLAVAPVEVEPGGTIDVAATIDDTHTGGAFVSGGSVTLGGVEVAQLQPERGGEFDMPVEHGEATVGPLHEVGDHELCVSGVDRNGNWSAEPACVTVRVLDLEAPLLQGLTLEPSEIAQGDGLVAELTATDLERGASAITTSVATVGDGVPVAVRALDGDLDGPFEELVVEVSPSDTAELRPGRHRLCVTAADAAGNTSEPLCARFEVTGDAAEGEGTIATTTGEASFVLDVFESDDRPVGTVDFTSGLLDFHGSDVTVLEVRDSSTAQIEVAGQLAGGIPCTATVDVTEGGHVGPDVGHFAIELRCGPGGVVPYAASGPLTSGSVRVDGM